MHVLGLWEGNGIAREKPMQTQGEHANFTQSDWDLYLGPSRYEATALTTHTQKH